MAVIRVVAQTRGFLALGRVATFARVAFVGVVVCVAVAVCGVGTAMADPAVEAREADGRAAFKRGSFDEALATFTRLYAETGDPIFLRNIGRCYQEMRVPDRAIESFREYLHRAKNLDPGEREAVTGFIREMQALKAHPTPPKPGSRPLGAAESVPPVVVPPVAPTTLVPPAADVPAGGARPAGPPALGPRPPPLPDADGGPDQTRVAGQPFTAISKPLPPPRSSPWRWACIGTGGAGAAALMVGGVLGLKMRSLEGTVETNSAQARRLDRDNYDRGTTLETWQKGAYLTGAVALVAAGVFLFLDRRQGAGP